MTSHVPASPVNALSMSRSWIFRALPKSYCDPSDRTESHRRQAIRRHVEPALRAELQLALVDLPPDSEIGMRPIPVRRVARADVLRRGGDCQSGVGVKLVADGQLQLVRIPRLTVQPVPHLHHRLVDPVVHTLPVGPPGQPVDRVQPGRLGQVELLVDAGEGVLPVRDPIRPREHVLPDSRMRRLVLPKAHDHLALAVREPAKPTADAHHGAGVLARRESPTAPRTAEFS